jgi:hypothetical protein
MPEATFPKPVKEIVAILADIFQHQGRLEIVELLQNATARIEQTGYDYWNGGTYYWALCLEAPVTVFVSVEPRLEAIEKEIKAKLSYFNRTYPNDNLNIVTVAPLSSVAAPSSTRFVPSDFEVRRIWPNGFFRLFLSHVSEHLAEVASLKEELRIRGVDAFVAHKDVQPSLEWQNEIEHALRSMDALAALFTVGFCTSRWTDQEIGWALGQGLLVLPVRLPDNPYGFVSKVQGVAGRLREPDKLAASIVAALLVSPRTHDEMRRSLVGAFSGAESRRMASALHAHIIKVDDFTDEEKAALRKACTDNDQVSGVCSVTAAVYEAFGKSPALVPVSMLSDDDNIPF